MKWPHYLPLCCLAAAFSACKPSTDHDPNRTASSSGSREYQSRDQSRGVGDEEEARPPGPNPDSHDGKRVAIVIGNSLYDKSQRVPGPGDPRDPGNPNLPNPANDALLVHSTFRKLGFTLVPPEKPLTNATRQEMLTYLNLFVSKARGAELAVIYYAGHGAANKDRNHIIPVDAFAHLQPTAPPGASDEEKEADFAAQMESYTLSHLQLLEKLKDAEVKARVLVLDCCRDSGLARKTFGLQRDRASGGEGGLVAIQRNQLPPATLVMFSAGPGQTAKDGAGGNSVFTEAFARQIQTRKDIYVALRDVSVAVKKKVTNQTPWLESEGDAAALADIRFVPEKADASVVDEPAQVDAFAGTSAGQTWENSMGTAFRWCPPGEFYMGSSSEDRSTFARDGVTTDDEVQHRVKLTKGFWLSQNDCTQGEWESLMGRTLKDQARLMLHNGTDIMDLSNGKLSMIRDFSHRDLDPGTVIGVASPSIPIYFVSWEEAVEYCQKLTSREHGNGKLPSGWRYALPSEAQWEYACRAGTEMAIYTGSLAIQGKDNAPALDAIAWYSGNSSVGYEGQGWDTKAWPEKQYPGGMAGPRRVGQKKPNAWGLCDMIGNVWQWCADYYGPYDTENLVDPSGPAMGAYRVDRGGSWHYDAAAVYRAAYRDRNVPGYREDNLGFRPALIPSR